MGREGGVAILLTGIIVFIVFGILIIVHEAGHLIAAKKAGIRVEAFSLGMGKRLFGIAIGGTDYRVSLIPFGGFCQMAGEDPHQAKGAKDEFGSKPVGARFWVVAAGSITNYIFAFLLFSIVFMIGSPVVSNEVGQLLKGYPAEKAGIKTGDKILSVNGKKVEYWDDIVSEIAKGSLALKPLEMEILRSKETMIVEVTPEVSTVTNIFNQKISRPVVGIAPENKILAVSYNPVKALFYGGKKLIALTAVTYKSIWLLLTGGMPLKTSVSGPIGIACLIGQAANMGLVYLILVMAHISMALAVFNLLPFPVLDGGHIFFLIIEKLRGKPLSVKTQEIIAQAALVGLISLALFVSWQDILRIIR
ncbi:MAG: RIP metalloprotease RseP [Candidatus Omnitrophota bacterium]